jgi:hypothetical protein
LKLSGSLYIGKVSDKNKQPCDSVFRLAGKNEDALTFALGYLLSKDPVFCVAFLKQCGVIERKQGKQWSKLFLSKNYEVHLQEITDRNVGRRDVVIEFESHIRVVLEAKIGKAAPTAAQLLKYAKDPKDWDRFNPKSEYRAIVAITRDKLSQQTIRTVEQKLKNSAIRFYDFQWYQLYSLVQTFRRNDTLLAPEWLFDEFVHFFRRDYEMKHYDVEVAIQDVDNLNAEIFFQGWMYVTNQKDKAEPLYFAPYLTNTIKKGSSYKSPYNGISEVSRVHRVEDVKVEDLLSKDLATLFRLDVDYRERWKLGLEMIKKRAVKESWQGATRLYFLEEPFKLPRDPLTKKVAGIPRQIPKGFSRTFDQLLK